MSENENNDMPIDFRSLADDFSQHEDLMNHEHQLDHPGMAALRDTIYYNVMSDNEREMYDYHNINAGGNIPAKDAYEVLKETLSSDGTVDRKEVEEQFYAGLMDDHRYKLFLEEKKNTPQITAKQFWEAYCKNYEPTAVKKLESGFRALMNEPFRTKKEKEGQYFTREQVMKMTQDEVVKNYDDIKRSEKKWK